MADSSNVDAALATKLLNDATLIGLMEGVWFDVAPSGKTKFVLVRSLAHEDEYIFHGQAWERFEYSVTAVHQSTSGDTVKQGAARIHALLQDGTLALTGYGLMVMQRLERLRFAEIDQENDQRWQHRGGRYEILVQPT